MTRPLRKNAYRDPKPARPENEHPLYQAWLLTQSRKKISPVIKTEIIDETLPIGKQNIKRSIRP